MGRRGRRPLGDVAASEMVSVRLTPFERETMTGWAAESGQTLSEWIRACCTSAIAASADLVTGYRTGDVGGWSWSYHAPRNYWVFSHSDDTRLLRTRLLLRVHHIRAKRYEFTTTSSAGDGPSADALVGDDERGFVELVTSLASVASWPDTNDLYHAAIDAWAAKRASDA